MVKSIYVKVRKFISGTFPYSPNPSIKELLLFHNNRTAVRLNQGS